MSYWPWYVAGSALAGVALLHWFAIGRMMAVSGRYTALVNRFRFGATAAAPKMTPEELRAAFEAATAAAFGPAPGDCDAPEPTAPPAPAPPASKKSPALSQPQTLGTHVLFLASLLVGGLLSTILGGTWSPVGGLRGEIFARFFPGPLGFPILLFGGLLVGFGTRMAAGCTSGHGLCGVSRIQPGSLLTTAAFFGVGIVTSFALGAVL